MINKKFLKGNHLIESGVIGKGVKNKLIPILYKLLNFYSL